MLAPCSNCPFRRKGHIKLRAGRVAEIAEQMLSSSGSSFTCHKTTVDGLNSKKEPLHRQEHCAGATIFAEKNGNMTQWMRWMERCHVYDPDRLRDPEVRALVFDTIDEMLEGHAEPRGSQ